MGTSIQFSINLNKPIDCTYIHNGYQFDAFLTLRYGMFVKIFKIRENNDRPRWEILRIKLNLSSESFETCPAVTDRVFFNLNSSKFNKISWQNSSV